MAIANIIVLILEYVYRFASIFFLVYALGSAVVCDINDFEDVKKQGNKIIKMAAVIFVIWVLLNAAYIYEASLQIS